MSNRTSTAREVRFVTIASILLTAFCQRAGATDNDAPEEAAPVRPPIMFNRWQEDWSVLADPRVPRQEFDDLKYLSLSATDPHTYLSLGADLRERFEYNDAASFGTGANRKDSYDISRFEAHADLRVTDAFQAFVQLQSDYAIGKTSLSPVDQDRLDVEQAFVAIAEPLEGGTLKLRLGRQQFGFDLQRFVSVRDGPNVRQSYDAAWFDYEHGQWRTIAFYSHPVQDRDVRLFDDVSNNRLTYGGFRVERKLSETSELAAYWSRFTQDGAKFPSISGNDRRDIVDMRYAGTVKAFDWDVEAMNQTGTISNDTIEAWAFGSLAGYTIRSLPWEPRLGFQVDAASGDKNPNDHHLNTFNPLFPNGYYVTLAGYTGFVNFIHLKPSVTVHPIETLKLVGALGFQWRETTADAVYTQPDIGVPGTAGRSGRYTGTYGQLRADWAVTYHVALALEVVHFAVDDAVREIGGHDSNYVGAEVKYGW
jgi:alginate export protein